MFRKERGLVQSVTNRDGEAVLKVPTFKTSRLSTAGFTLIELLVVIAIIGILSSVVLASLNTARQKSRDARRVSDMKQMQIALEGYFDSNEIYPSAISDLVPAGFLPAVPNDPGLYSYSYELLSAGVDYVLRVQLENTSHIALSSDTDGTIGTTDCSDLSGYYCVQP